MSKSICIIVPVFNEESCLEELYSRLKSMAVAQKNYVFKIIFVDDGSSDRTVEILAAFSAADPHVRVLSFSRNFGHQIAIKAGIDHTDGDAAILIDADLQDPPEAIPDLIRRWEEGFQVVYATRASREGESFFKKATSSLYYRMLKRISSIDIPLATGEFRLISREVVDVLKSIRECNPYMRGLVAWAGFKQTRILINRQARFAGETKYPLSKLFRLASHGIVQFSIWPLRAALYAGFFFILAALAGAAGWLWGDHSPWMLVVAALFLIGGVQLLFLGTIGEYVALNLDQARSRPLYVLKKP